MSRGQTLMDKAEEERNTVRVELEMMARNPGCSAVITDTVTIKVDRRDSLATLQDELVEAAVEKFRANLEITASIQSIE